MRIAKKSDECGLISERESVRRYSIVRSGFGVLKSSNSNIDAISAIDVYISYEIYFL